MALSARNVQTLHTSLGEDRYQFLEEIIDLIIATPPPIHNKDYHSRPWPGAQIVHSKDREIPRWPYFGVVRCQPAYLQQVGLSLGGCDVTDIDNLFPIMVFS
jgi:hypothetical protein